MAIRKAEYGGYEKLCHDCQEWWPADTEFFYKDKANSDGFMCYCKDCYTIRKKKSLAKKKVRV